MRWVRLSPYPNTRGIRRDPQNSIKSEYVDLVTKGKEIGYSYIVVTILRLIRGNGGGLDKGASCPWFKRLNEE